jgi:ppGpp synthetase/RelA/SpoT-type nucleotidyltranferase
MELDTLGKEYDSLHALAEHFREELTHEIEQLLSNESIALGVPLESRVKSWYSAAQEFERLGLQLGSVKDLNDLVGLRLILLFRLRPVQVGDDLSESAHA